MVTFLRDEMLNVLSMTLGHYVLTHQNLGVTEQVREDLSGGGASSLSGRVGWPWGGG